MIALPFMLVTLFTNCSASRSRSDLAMGGGAFAEVIPYRTINPSAQQRQNFQNFVMGSSIAPKAPNRSCLFGPIYC